MELQFIGETYLKVAPVPADDLDPKDKVLKAPGQSETVKAVRFADTGPIPAIEVKHIKVETDSTVWYVYGPHVYLEKGTDKKAILKFNQDTYLKAAPVPDNELEEDQKVSKKPGAEYQETIVKAGFSEFVVEKKHIEVVTDSNETWFVYAPHVEIENEG